MAEILNMYGSICVLRFLVHLCSAKGLSGRSFLDAASEDSQHLTYSLLNKSLHASRALCVRITCYIPVQQFAAATTFFWGGTQGRFYWIDSHKYNLSEPDWYQSMLSIHIMLSIQQSVDLQWLSTFQCLFQKVLLRFLFCLTTTVVWLHPCGPVK